METDDVSRSSERRRRKGREIFFQNDERARREGRERKREKKIIKYCACRERVTCKENMERATSRGENEVGKNL